MNTLYRLSCHTNPMQDVDEFRRLATELLPHLSPSHANPDQLGRVELVLQWATVAMAWAQDEDGQSALRRPAGMALLMTTSRPWRKSGRIEDVVVHPDFAGQGIGRRLMEMLIAKAGELGYESLSLTSHPSREAANRLYPKLGFKRYETNVYRLDL